MAEALTGDLDTGFKRRLEGQIEREGVLSEIERDAFRELVSDAPHAGKLSELMNEFVARESNEALIVKCADVIDSFFHARDVLKREFPTYLAHAARKLRGGGEVGDVLARVVESLPRCGERV